jgi:hypothetical protein
VAKNSNLCFSTLTIGILSQTCMSRALLEMRRELLSQEKGQWVNVEKIFRRPSGMNSGSRTTRPEEVVHGAKSGVTQKHRLVSIKDIFC